MGLVIIWILFGICASVVGSNRGESAIAWFVLGALFGPIGFAFAFTAGVKCPKCASKISAKATVCPRCNHHLIKPGDPLWNAAVLYSPPPLTKACPFCAEQILEDAKKCRYCGEFLEKATAQG